MKTLKISTLIAFPLLLPSIAFAEDYLTGDTKLACEAVLCLSSGVRPSECSPSLSRYFGIHKKKWHKTLDARRAFLRLCPDANAGKMESLVDVIVNGAGQCSAAELNATNLKTIVERVCYEVEVDGCPEQRCHDQERTVISEILPKVCQNYAAHDYTFKVSAHYVGEPEKDGHWVDDAKE